MNEAPEREKGGGDHDEPYTFGKPKGYRNALENIQAVRVKSTMVVEVERKHLLEKLKSERNARGGKR